MKLILEQKEQEQLEYLFPKVNLEYIDWSYYLFEVCGINIFSEQVELNIINLCRCVFEYIHRQCNGCDNFVIDTSGNIDCTTKEIEVIIETDEPTELSDIVEYYQYIVDNGWDVMKFEE